MSRAPELLNDLQQALAWLRARVTGQLQTDSRQVQPGDGFINKGSASNKNKVLLRQNIFRRSVRQIPRLGVALKY